MGSKSPGFYLVSFKVRNRLTQRSPSYELIDNFFVFVDSFTPTFNFYSTAVAGNLCPDCFNIPAIFESNEATPLSDVYDITLTFSAEGSNSGAIQSELATLNPTRYTLEAGQTLLGIHLNFKTSDGVDNVTVHLTANQRADTTNQISVVKELTFSP
jgi:hypothetical protein